MTSSVLDAVRSLVDKSLLRSCISGEDEPRLTLLELVRAYALERLAECGELEQARDAHAARSSVSWPSIREVLRRVMHLTINLLDVLPTPRVYQQGDASKK
jgi:hypothetical protein